MNKNSKNSRSTSLFQRVFLLLFLGAFGIFATYFAVQRNQNIGSKASLEGQVRFEPVYRLYSEGVNDHFYVMGATEANTAVTDSGFTFEGIEFWGVRGATNNSGLLPVYRLYNPTNHDHFYTKLLAEKQKVINDKTYVDEGIAFYAFNKNSDWGGLVPVYRLFNGKDHFYSSDKEEMKFALTIGYKAQGIAFYAPPLPRQNNIKAVFSLSSHDQLLLQYGDDITGTIKKYGYRLDGLAFFAHQDTSASPLLKPVYRMSKAGKAGRFYTISDTEKKEMESKGYTTEGAFFFAYEASSSETVPVFRLVNNDGNYVHTASMEQKDAAMAKGYTLDKEAFYAPRALPEYISL